MIGMERGSRVDMRFCVLLVDFGRDEDAIGEEGKASPEASIALGMLKDCLEGVVGCWAGKEGATEESSDFGGEVATRGE